MTGYDGMVIPRVKGKRRELRRMLAQRSKELLAGYRRGEANGEECPLQRALVGIDPGVEPDRRHLPILSLKDTDLGAGGDDLC